MSKSIRKTIIGSGFIASKFKKKLQYYKKYNITIYAAGISNSLEKNKKNLSREINKIKKFIKLNTKQLIYISTYSILDKSRKDKPYVKNKIKSGNILISAHGNSIRALCKYLFKLDEKQISKLEIPTGNPLLIEIDENEKINNCNYLDQDRAKDLLVF